MSKKVRFLTALVFSTVILLVLPCMAQQTAPSGAAGAEIKISPQVRAMAKNPVPPADAQQKTSDGTGDVVMGTKNSPDDTDSSWVDEIDVDGDGNMEKADLLWDDEDKVLFISYQDDYVCKNGGMGKGSILIGLNGEGNARNRPVGSGFYTLKLDKSECGSQTARLWGCKFDADGNATACGVAVLDEKNDTLAIATVSQ
jgi:hypothetical protein